MTEAADRKAVLIASFNMPDQYTYYFWLYYKALLKYGYRLVSTKNEAFSLKWLTKNRRIVSIIHLHWPAYLYSRKNSIPFLIQLIKFSFNLLFARLLGYKLVWTAHNLYPHEMNNRHLEYWARMLLIFFSNFLFCHFQGGIQKLQEEFHCRKAIYKIPHGDFLDIFPNQVSRSYAREVLGIPEKSFVFLVFGNVRYYKGLGEVIAGFSAAAEEDDLLMIVGKNPDSAEVARISRIDPRILVFNDKIRERKVQFYFNASDCCIIHYREIFTSGNIFLAMGFSLPIVAVNKGIIHEVVKDDFGILYHDHKSMVSALKKIKEMELQAAGKSAYEELLKYRWEDAAKISAEAFRMILSDKELNAKNC